MSTHLSLGYWLGLTLLLLAGCAARPQARFTVEQPTVAVMDPVTCTNNTEGATAYRWEFGDGTSSTEANPTHRYFSSGTYNVVLAATDERGKTTLSRQSVTVTPPSRCLVRIETPYGDMIAQLYDATPLHQNNFIKLAEQNYYDSLLFHRVINGFMIQGGDPNSRGAEVGQALGMGGPDYTIPAEFVDTLIHRKGALAAARTNNPEKRSSGAQFYIVQGKPVDATLLDKMEARGGFRYPTAVREEYYQQGGTPFLDQEYTVFGQVIEGLDVIDEIAGVRTGAADRPVENVWMKVSIIK